MKNIHDIEKRAMLLDRAAILELVSIERKLRAVVEAAKETAPFCEEPTVTELGFVPCDVCPECILRLSLAAMEEETE